MASSGLQKAKVLKKSLPPLSVFPDDSIGYYARYRIISEDRNRTSHWSPVYAVAAPDVTLVAGTFSFVDDVLRLVWDTSETSAAYDIFVEWGADIKKIEITTTTVIVETLHDALFVAGERVELFDIIGTFAGLNGIHTVTNVSGKFVSFSKPSGIGVEPSTVVDGAMFRVEHDYHGTASVHDYSFITNTNFDLVRAYVQVEGIVKERQAPLTVFTSNVLVVK